MLPATEAIYLVIHKHTFSQPRIHQRSHIIIAIMHSPSIQTSNQLTAYTIFLILERQRNFKLRELYRNKQVAETMLLPMISEESSSASASSSSSTNTPSPTTRKSSLRQAMKQKKKKKRDASSISSMSTLPKFPPRYQALSNIITSDVLMMQLRTTTTTPPCSNRQRSPSSLYMEEYKNLDQCTKRFLNDTAKLLQDRCNEEVENNETKLEIHMRRGSMKKRTKVVGGSKLFVFRVEKKLSVIVD